MLGRLRGLLLRIVDVVAGASDAVGLFAESLYFFRMKCLVFVLGSAQRVCEFIGLIGIDLRVPLSA